MATGQVSPPAKKTKKLPEPQSVPSQPSGTTSLLTPEQLVGLGLDPQTAAALAQDVNNRNSSDRRDATVISQADSFLRSLQTPARPTAAAYGFMGPVSRREPGPGVPHPADIPMTRSQIKAWQEKLAAWKREQGIITNYTYGAMDEETKQDTYRVFAQLVDNPGVYGSADDALAALTASARDNQAAIQASKAKEVTRASPFRPMPEIRLRTLVETAFGKTVGRNPFGPEYQKFSQAYRQMEREHYEQELASDMNPAGGGTVEQLPNVQEVVFSSLDETPEAFGQTARGFAKQISQIVRGG